MYSKVSFAITDFNFLQNWTVTARGGNAMSKALSTPRNHGINNKKRAAGPLFFQYFINFFHHYLAPFEATCILIMARSIAA